MVIVFGTLSVVALLAFVLWNNKKQEKKVGSATKLDKQKASGVFVLSFLSLLVVFYFSVAAYVCIVAISAIIYQFIGIGSTEHGWYRQIRDGYFVGFIASIPLCWYIYELQT